MTSRTFKLLDSEEGFTSSVIRDPERFVGRQTLLTDALRAIKAKTGLITVFGKRGVGKSSLMRQIQNMATGDLSILSRAGLGHLITGNEPRYYTVFYTCDSHIKNAEQLFQRICSDNDEVDGLLRLVPDKGKEIIEVSRTKEVSGGADLKVVNWGAKGSELENYKKTVDADIFQTFRNFVNSIIESNNRAFESRRGVLVFIDEFDVIEDKSGIDSLIKAISSEQIKFAISCIGDDLTELISDHGSVERLVEQGYAHVKPMSRSEVAEIFRVAEARYQDNTHFDESVIDKVAELSEGYPYFAQLIGKACIEKRNELGVLDVTGEVLQYVLEDISNGRAFPSLESRYQRAVGEAEGRAIILTLLAEQEAELNDEQGLVSLKNIRGTAQDLDIEHVDQLVPRLIDKNYGPALVKREEKRGTYEFVDPVLRAYVKLRR